MDVVFNKMLLKLLLLVLYAVSVYSNVFSVTIIFLLFALCCVVGSGVVAHVCCC